MALLPLFKRNPLHQRIIISFLPSLLINGAVAPIPQSSTLLFFFSSKSSSSQEPLMDLLESYGFNPTQIKHCLKRSPLMRSTEIIKPKLQHLLAFGFSPSQLIKLISYDPNILGVSLKERIEPNLSLLQSTFGSKTNIIQAVNRGLWLLTRNLEKQVIPNLNLLKMNGMSTDKITFLFTKYPLVLAKDPSLISETIDRLKGLGMRPSTLSFIHGMKVVATLKKETWERKMELYRSFEWSETDTLSAFARQPTCMLCSDDKIKKQMEFFKEKLEWDSALVLRRVELLTLSLEGRIIPRCAVLNELAKNGLWDGKPPVYTLFKMGADKFKEKFVDKYEKEVPQVIDAYQGKIDFVGFESTVVAQSLKP